MKITSNEKCVLFAHTHTYRVREYVNEFECWVRSWIFVSGGEWFDLYKCVRYGLMYGTTVIKFVCECVCVRSILVWFIIGFYIRFHILQSWHHINRNGMKVNRWLAHIWNRGALHSRLPIWNWNRFPNEYDWFVG